MRIGWGQIANASRIRVRTVSEVLCSKRFQRGYRSGKRCLGDLCRKKVSELLTTNSVAKQTRNEHLFEDGEVDKVGIIHSVTQLKRIECVEQVASKIAKMQ
jgi:hypothetical protein